MHDNIGMLQRVGGLERQKAWITGSCPNEQNPTLGREGKNFHDL